MQTGQRQHRYLFPPGLLLLIVFFQLNAWQGLSQATLPDTIKVGIYDNPPKVFRNDQGEPSGIFIDLLEEIADHEDLTIEYRFGTWEDLLKELQSGQINLLPDMAFSTERDSIYSLGQLSVLGSWLEIFTTKRLAVRNIKDISGHSIGVLRGSVQEKFITENFKNTFNLDYSLKEYSSYTECAEALKSGEVDLMIAGRFFYFSEFCDDDIQPSGIILRPTELYFATTRDRYPQLISLIDRNLARLKNDPRSHYYLTLQKYFDKRFSLRVPFYIYLGLGLAIALIFIISIFTFLLRKQVKQRTNDLNQQNIELQKAKKKAEESDLLKSIFLQNISHEIRTPLNGILGFVELLRQEEMTPETFETYSGIINSSSQRMLSTINSLIEISRIEAGEVNIHSQSVDTNNLLSQIVAENKFAASLTGLRLEKGDHLKGQQAFVHSDPVIISNILNILVLNAIKFTEEGSIKVGTSVNDDGLIFFVEDTGIGITKERQEAIFQRFVQEDTSLSRRYEGLGLGLAIAWGWTQILNGKLSVNSEPGHGSIFSLCLPR